MTEARDRPAARRGPEWDERSLFSGQAGIPWWAAIALALVITAAGAFLDFERLGRLGLVFQACYFLGCLLAVIAVQRKGLFGPMVQPPLLLALAVPSVVLLTGFQPSGGLIATALAVGTPLLNGFPTMAITTGVTVSIGAFRLATQRRRSEKRTPSANTPSANTRSASTRSTSNLPVSTRSASTPSSGTLAAGIPSSKASRGRKPRDPSPPPRTRSAKPSGPIPSRDLATGGPPTDPARGQRRPQ